MNFKNQSFKEEPEINLVPFIDILLVIVIFLSITTTYDNFSNIQINLPTSQSESKSKKKNNVIISITINGEYIINKKQTLFEDAVSFASKIQKAVGGNPDPTIIINADANTSHQSVINVMESAQIAGYGKLTFSTQKQN